ncbi:MAG TPA: EAL domain-containing protein [Methylibium sp.]|nr:EAL domain-containing protein [Methylibium sp.]
MNQPLAALHADGSAEAAELLLVDDDDPTRIITADALKAHGFIVTEAASGEEAFELLARWSPDILVLDAKMPGMDGFEACRRLRRLPGFEMLPVLMLTGLDDPESIRQAYEAGATDFFVKSTQWSLLEMRLRHLLRASRTVRDLDRSNNKLARAQALARLGSFEWWRGRDHIELSPDGLAMFGLPAGEPVTLRRLLRLLADVKRRAPLVDRLHDTLRSGTPFSDDISVEVRFGRPRLEGTEERVVRTVRVEAEPSFDEHGAVIGYTGFVQDVTERRLAMDRIRHLADFDTLTKLPNRGNLLRRADRAVEHAQRMNHHVGVLLIDLDRFKEINDTLGHKAGDEVLREVAERLKGCVRHSDVVPDPGTDLAATRAHRQYEGIGRLGGDEFVALLPDLPSDPAKADEAVESVAQRVLEVMREPVVIDGKDYFVTASVGVSLFPRDGSSMIELLSSADVAMYTVKDAGRNNFSRFHPQLAGRGREKLELHSALHRAIERGELVLHYQPKVDVSSARMVGVEALMRWRRGDRLVPPGEFIPLAEETGLIVPMSEWLVREAARQAGVWHGRGIDTSIAVNLPGLVFERCDVAALILEATTEHGVAHRAIEVEITERTLMKRLKDSQMLLRLNAAGIEIAIDDFGTDYSSLSSLSELPISELKIDRSFVTGLGVTMKSSAVANVIIALARSLGMRVVAEGVESLRQMERLKDLGCTVMQGYLFSPPLPGTDLADWLEQTVLPRNAPWIDAGSGYAASLRALPGGPPPAD